MFEANQGGRVYRARGTMPGLERKRTQVDLDTGSEAARPRVVEAQQQRGPCLHRRCARLPQLTPEVMNRSRQASPRDPLDDVELVGDPQEQGGQKGSVATLRVRSSQEQLAPGVELVTHSVGTMQRRHGRWRRRSVEPCRAEPTAEVPLVFEGVGVADGREWDDPKQDPNSYAKPHCTGLSIEIRPGR